MAYMSLMTKSYVALFHPSGPFQADSMLALVISPTCSRSTCRELVGMAPPADRLLVNEPRWCRQRRPEGLWSTRVGDFGLLGSAILGLFGHRQLRFK